MRVLIACESSGTVRQAFRDRGHDAWSCDLLPADDASPYHVTGDAAEVLADRWDLLIAHPPCTYLTNAGACWLYDEDGGVNEERWELMRQGAAFFRLFWECKVPHVCIENPVMHGHASRLIGADFAQSVQPWQFGHRECKRTCFWLRGLPLLQPTSDLQAETMALPYAERCRLHCLPPGPDRWKIRSKTFEGIAAAMADQWGGLSREQLDRLARRQKSLF